MSGGPGYIEIVSAIALLAVLAWAMVRPLWERSRSQPIPQASHTAKLKITGMTCSHCVSAVQRALSESAGVQQAQVDLKSGSATVAGDDLDVAELCQAVQSLGYQAEPAD